MPARLFAACGAGAPEQPEQSEWFTRLQRSYNQALLLDRHLLHDIETNVCIASLPESGAHGFTTVESHRLQLAHKFKHRLNFRELPVSLLRLFFCGQQHFHQIIGRIPNSQFKALAGLCPPAAALSHHFDMGVAESDMDVQQPVSDAALAATQYEADVQRVSKALRLALDYTFCSFERTLTKLLSLFHGDNDAVDSDDESQWCHMGLYEALQGDDPYWANVPRPPIDIIDMAAARGAPAT